MPRLKHSLLTTLLYSTFIFFMACGNIPNEEPVASSTTSTTSGDQTGSTTGSSTDSGSTTGTDSSSGSGSTTGSDSGTDTGTDTGSDSDSGSDTGGTTTVEETPHEQFLRGEELFTTNCASCHGSFETRPVEHIPLYTEARIQWGIVNAVAMQSLSFLTEEEILTIIYALQVNTQTISEGDDIIVYDTPVP